MRSRIDLQIVETHLRCRIWSFKSQDFRQSKTAGAMYLKKTDENIQSAK